MYSLIALGVIIIVSAIIVRTGAVALRLTGLDEETSAFQALSAFTNTGFTTLEAERIVNHPHRRRIIKVLIILGNAGLAGVIVTLLKSFGGSGGENTVLTQVTLLRLAALGGFLLLFYFFVVARPVKRAINRFIEKRLTSATDLGFVEFQAVLALGGEYGISYVEITPQNPVAGKTLLELALSRINVLVLSIEREGKNMPTPSAGTVIEAGDRLVCYGKTHSMRVLAKGAYDPNDRAPHNPTEENRQDDAQ